MWPCDAVVMSPSPHWLQFPVAQWLEHPTSVRVVVGLNPICELRFLVSSPSLHTHLSILFNLNLVSKYARIFFPEHYPCREARSSGKMQWNPDFSNPRFIKTRTQTPFPWINVSGILPRLLEPIFVSLWGSRNREGHCLLIITSIDIKKDSINMSTVFIRVSIWP